MSRDALDKLFSVPVDEFMATRETLAAQLKTAGDKQGAAAVKAVAKPTQAAHALNQLARNAAAELTKLFKASRELASGKDFKTALERQRAALEEVRAKMSGSHSVELMTVLRGAMVDEALAARVMEGHFSKLPEIQVGFFGAAPEGGVVKPKAPKEPRVKKGPPRLEVIQGEREEAAREKARREKEERQKAERAERLAREIKEAQTELSKLNATADAAERAAVHARRQAKVAADRLDALKTRAAATDD